MTGVLNPNLPTQAVWSPQSVLTPALGKIEEKGVGRGAKLFSKQLSAPPKNLWQLEQHYCWLGLGSGSRQELGARLYHLFTAHFLFYLIPP